MNNLVTYNNKLVRHNNKLVRFFDTLLFQDDFSIDQGWTLGDTWEISTGALRKPFGVSSNSTYDLGDISGIESFRVVYSDNSQEGTPSIRIGGGSFATMFNGIDQEIILTNGYENNLLYIGASQFPVVAVTNIKIYIHIN